MSYNPIMETYGAGPKYRTAIDREDPVDKMLSFYQKPHQQFGDRAFKPSDLKGAGRPLLYGKVADNYGSSMYDNLALRLSMPDRVTRNLLMPQPDAPYEINPSKGVVRKG